MDVLLVILKADPARGGAERYTVDLADGLSRRGHRVALAASEFAGVEGIARVELAVQGITKIGRYAHFLDALGRHLAEHTYDIVHAMLPVRRCDVYHPHAGIAAEAILSGHLKHSGILKQKAAAVANHLNIKRRRFADVERELISSERAPVTLCLSDYITSVLRRHYPDARAEKLFNAVDLEKFDPARRIDAGMTVRREFGVTAAQTVALMIAQDFERKGLRETLMAMKQLDDRSLTLLIVGKEDPTGYRKLANDLGIADRVVFAGATRDPYSFYKAADFFVLPTRHDPCSLVVLESLAMGVPVISTVKNGACEIMTDGVHGSVLQDPEDVTALAESLRKWMDGGLRRSASDHCLSLRGELSYTHHLERLEAIYERIRDEKKNRD